SPTPRSPSDWCARRADRSTRTRWWYWVRRNPCRAGRRRPGQTLTEAMDKAATEAERASAALALARHLVWMEREFPGGTRVLTDAIDASSDPAARAELRAELAICLAVAGDAEATLRITDGVLTEPAASPRATLSALVQSTLARTILGRYDGLPADLDRADALASELRAELPLAVAQLATTLV